MLSASDGSDVLLMNPAGRGRPRELFSGPGRFGQVAFSPDGRRLLVPWPDADQWLFLSSSRGGHVGAVANIGRQFARGRAERPVPGRGRVVLFVTARRRARPRREQRTSERPGLASERLGVHLQQVAPAARAGDRLADARAGVGVPLEAAVLELDERAAVLRREA